LKKRSIVSFDDDDVDDHEQDQNVHCYKRLKVSRALYKPSFKGLDSMTGQEHDATDIAIVSPSRGKPILQFNFDEIDRPVVSPTPLDNGEPAMVHLSDNTGVRYNDHGSGPVKGILTMPLALPSSKSRKRHRVMFSEKPPEVFHPCSVTPESSSDCEGC
jgi:hypothetical protein